MKLLVTGSQGQVAKSLHELGAICPGISVQLLGRPDIDLSDPLSTERVIAATDADLIVSAAAYTAVDAAEDEPDLAYDINVRGAEAVAKAAAARGLPVIHLSTDYVFSGHLDRLYDETDLPDPQGVYGRTKLLGEQAVVAVNPRAIILRTAWVYSPFGKNFVRTMLRLAGERDEVSVVADQWGNPTSALDISDGILCIARRLVKDPEPTLWGTYNLVGSGSTTWSGFAEEIMRVSGTIGGPSATIRPITTADYPTKARRPANSRLSTAKLTAVFDWQPPDWRNSTGNVVTRLLRPD